MFDDAGKEIVEKSDKKGVDRWTKRQNKKIVAKKIKVKQKKAINRLANKMPGNKEPIPSWDSIDIQDNHNLEKGYIAGIKGNAIKILNREKEKFIDAKPNEDISEKLTKSLIVGDIVYYENINGNFVIQKRENRANYLARIKSDSSRFGADKEQAIVANVDIALIVSPIKNPDFDHNLIDRYLILCQNGGVKPVICLNKVDLTDRRDPIIKQYKDLGIQIIEASTLNGTGIQELKSLLIGKISVVLGKSGVGKTSLVNALNTNNDLRTQDINKKSGEGKHTTTSSDLHKREKDSYIVDTPGIRALGIDQVSRSELKNYFVEFRQYDGMCKYDNCLHESEPSCAIKNAVESNEIKKERYASYLRMLKDLV